MCLLKKKRPTTLTAISKQRAESCPKTIGLAPKVKGGNASEGVFMESSLTSLMLAEMIDATNPGPENLKHAVQAPEAFSSKKRKEIAREEPSRPVDASATKIAVPYTKSIVTGRSGN
ncbi:hypothetical protein K3495_g9831 [Podosphaera aphanis]|nr:hypothetical protein K3495_g9831 [Podosphaera aphanis]